MATHKQTDIHVMQCSPGALSLCPN